MKELGVGMIQRKAAAALKPTLYISNNGDQWTLKLVSTLKSTEITATIGQDFNEETLDGRKSKSLLTQEGPNKLVHVQRDPSNGNVTSTIVREVVGDELVQTLTAGSVTCKRVYKRS